MSSFKAMLVDFFVRDPKLIELIVYTVIFCLCWSLESIFGVSENYKRKEHDRINFLFIIPGFIVQFILGFLFISILLKMNRNHMGLLYSFQIYSIVLQLVISFIVFDFFYYVYHYCMHKVKVAWCFHLVHHSDPILNVSTSLREHPFETVIRIGHYMIVAFILGCPVWFVAFHQFIQIISKIIIHSNFRLPEKLDRWLSLIFITPNMHHIHHHESLPYTDSNYGDLFSIWDRIFGTFQKLSKESTQFGLDSIPVNHSELGFGSLLLLPFYSIINRSDKKPGKMVRFNFQRNNKFNSMHVVAIPLLAIAFLNLVISNENTSYAKQNSQVVELKFHLSGLNPSAGYGRVVLYNNPDLFLSQFGYVIADSARVNELGQCDIAIHKVPEGTYAGAFYQDENDNYVIDRNTIGIPTEPYGFSNNVRAKWRVPSYESVSFECKGSEKLQCVHLAYWSAQ